MEIIKEQAAEVKQTPTVKDEKPQEESGSTRKNISVGPLIRQYSSDGILDAAAAAYIGHIREIVEDPAHRLPIKALKLRENMFGFSSGKYTIILVLETSSVKTYQEVINDDMSEVILAFKELYPKDQVLVNIVAVDQFSVERYPQMASYITRVLTSQVQPTNFTLNDIGREEHLTIDADPISVKRFIDKHSCSAANPTEFGFVASLVNKQKFQNGRYVKGDEFFGVGGYVEFIREESMPGSPVKFIPIIHISDIISVIPVTEIMAIAIPIAAEVFIGSGLWKQPFTNITKKGINIGNLIEDKNGKPWVAKTEIELVEFFSRYIAPPILVIDCVSGQARLPGLGKFASDSHHNELVTSFSKFLSIPEQTFGVPANTIFREVVGVSEVSSEINPTGIMDTRSMTYLFALNKIGITPGVAKLRYRYPQAESRIELMREELNLSVVPTSLNFCAMLNGPFVQACSSAVRSLGMSMPNIGNAQTIPIQGFGVHNYTTGNMFAASPVIGGQNYTF